MCTIGVVLGCVSDASAQALDRRIQSALDAADMDALLAVAELRESPADVWFMYLDLVNDCVSGTKCIVSLGPVDGAFTERQKQDSTERGLEWPAPVQGLVVITMTATGGKGRTTMPYGTVGGQPKVLGGRYAPPKLAELRAKTNASIIEELFAAGVFDAQSGERRTDWKKAAKPLPADGGEFGAFLIKRTAALNSAVKAQDPDAAAAASGAWGARVFGAKSYDGTAVPLALRRQKLRAQATRFFREVKVLGGYQLGNMAVLNVEGIDGVGWIKRGAVVVTKADNMWDVAGDNTISHPK
jgi:hypothetical protein